MTLSHSQARINMKYLSLENHRINFSYFSDYAQPNETSWNYCERNTISRKILDITSSTDKEPDHMFLDPELRQSFKRHFRNKEWKKNTLQTGKTRKISNKFPITMTTDEEDHGYQSSESPLLDDIRAFDEAPISGLRINQQHRISEFVNNLPGPNQQSKFNVAGISDTTRAETGTPETPYQEKKIHDQTLCCGNGFFQLTPGPFSEFEGNCSCTTHTLVDWQTRVTWSNSSLRHQIKVHEVTTRSPFRSGKSKRLSPDRLTHLLIEGSRYLEPVNVGIGIQGLPRRDLVLRERHNLTVEETDHQLIKESADKSYICHHPGCERTFYRNEELTRHTRIHTGQKPYICHICNRSFIRRDHLAKHQRTHLPAHAKRTYACPLPACTHSYTRSDALTRHMWTAHHIRARQPSRPRLTFVSTEAPASHLDDSSPLPSFSLSTSTPFAFPDKSQPPNHHINNHTPFMGMQSPYLLKSEGPPTSTSSTSLASSQPMTTYVTSPSTSFNSSVTSTSSFRFPPTIGSLNTAFTVIKRSNLSERCAGNTSMSEHYLPSPV